jgi:hypothetical protein
MLAMVQVAILLGVVSFLCGFFVVSLWWIVVSFWLLVWWGEKRLWFWDFFVVREAVARRLRSAKP